MGGWRWRIYSLSRTQSISQGLSLSTVCGGFHLMSAEMERLRGRAGTRKDNEKKDPEEI